MPVHINECCVFFRDALHLEKKHTKNHLGVEMSTEFKLFPWNVVLSVILGLVAAGVTWAGLERRLPFISDERGLFLTVAGVGFVMCCIGLPLASGQKAFSWLNPFVLVATVLGVLAMILIVLVLTGRQVPLLSGERQATIAMAAIIFLKWATAVIHQVIAR
jgi:hypothetical protein